MIRSTVLGTVKSIPRSGLLPPRKCTKVYVRSSIQTQQPPAKLKPTSPPFSYHRLSIIIPLAPVKQGEKFRSKQIHQIPID